MGLNSAALMGINIGSMIAVMSAIDSESALLQQLRTLLTYAGPRSAHEDL